LAWLNYSLGYMVKSNASDAIPYFLKAARLESPLKKTPAPYYFIAEGYEGLYAKQEADYNRLYKDKPETTESKLAQENINQLIDRTIDAYARAVAASTGSDEKTQAKKKEWMERLTELYKYRTKTETVPAELVAGALAKPLPDLPQPITTLPTPPSTGAAAPGGTTAPAGGSTTPPAKPAGTVSTTPAAPPKPTATPTPQASKPKPRAYRNR